MKRLLPRLTIMSVAFLVLPSAAFAGDELALSRDGRTWSSSLTTPLFDPDMRWVPGDDERSSFWVRNEAHEAGLLTVDVLGSRVDSLLRTGDLHVATRVGNGSWTATSLPGRQRLARTKVAPGATEKVQVRVSFDASSPNPSQQRSLELGFEVRLTQDEAVADAGAGLDSGHGGGTVLDGVLPDTGAPAVLTLTALAAALVAAGLTVITRKRDQQR